MDLDVLYPAMIKAPETRIGLRPVLSTQMTAGIVAANILYTHAVSHKLLHSPGNKTYTIPTTPVARRETLGPVRPRSLKMVGA